MDSTSTWVGRVTLCAPGRRKKINHHGAFIARRARSDAPYL
jgi:hypothetical protein